LKQNFLFGCTTKFPEKSQQDAWNQARRRREHSRSASQNEALQVLAGDP
jgi:hypothetical protein